MKNLCYPFLVLLFCNMSFSQEKISIKNDSIKSSIFKFYPNPAKNSLFILGTHKIKKIEFINNLGKHEAIHHFNRSIIKIDVSDFKKGLYLLKVTNENDKRETKKLVIK